MRTVLSAFLSAFFSLSLFLAFFHWIDTFSFHPILRSITIALVVLPGGKEEILSRYPSLFCSFPLFLAAFFHYILATNAYA